MKRAFIAISLAILVFSEGHAARRAVTVATIETDLKAKGAAFVYSHYFDCEEPSKGSGYKLVESGTPSGVRLGVEMLKYSDACWTESLESSLGTAMTRAPTVVLLYVNTNDLLSADHICLPFISEDEPDSKTKAIMARARQSLLRVHDKKLEKQKLACLNSIK